MRCRTQVQMLLQNHSLFTAFPQPDSWESILYINLFLGYWTHRGKIWGIWSHVFSCCYVAIFLFAIFCSCILNCTAVTLPVNRIFFFLMISLRTDMRFRKQNFVGSSVFLRNPELLSLSFKHVIYSIYYGPTQVNKY